MKNFSLLLSLLGIFAGAFFSTSCGILDNKKDEPLVCGVLANSFYTSGNEIGINDTSIAGSELAQSFTTVEKIKVAYVDLILRTEGSPNNTLSIDLQIQKDSAGVPDNVSLATAYVQISQISATFKTVHFAFNEIQLEENKKYWIRVNSTLAANTTNIVKWAGSNSNPYKSGEAKYFNGVNTWNDAAVGNFSGPTHDLVFNLDCRK